MRRWGASAAFVAVALAVAACSDDDAADPTTVATTESAAPPETSEATTTSTTEVTTTSSSTTTTTVAAPPTTTVAQQTAEVEAAFVSLNALVTELLTHPTLDDLESRVAEIAVQGSPFAELVFTRVTELVNNDQRIAPNNPSVETLTVERVELTGPTSANVTACQVSNALTVKNPASSPIPGESIPVGGSGGLVAARYTQSLVRTGAGWRHEGLTDPNDPTWDGLDSCPPS